MTTVSKELLIQARDALEEASNGLEWFKDSYPADVNGSDDEATERITAAIASLQAAIDQPEPEPIGWKWELLPGSKIAERDGQKSGVYWFDPKSIGIDLNSKRSLENYKWTLLYTTRPAPAIPTSWQYVMQLLVAAGHVTQEKVDEACRIVDVTPPAPIDEDQAYCDDADEDFPDEPECPRCHGDTRDPWCDYLLPCPECNQGVKP